MSHSALAYRNSGRLAERLGFPLALFQETRLRGTGQRLAILIDRVAFAGAGQRLAVFAHCFAFASCLGHRLCRLRQCGVHARDIVQFRRARAR